MFQESEHVSSDRLFRVRCKQPYASELSLSTQKVANTCAKPVTLGSVQVGDLCVFNVSDKMWRIGRVLQFAKYKGKSAECTQQYKGCAADPSTKNVGILCSWYDSVPGSERVFQLTHSGCSEYHPLSSYLCSLTGNCLEDENDDNRNDSVLAIKDKLLTSITNKILIIKEDCIAHINTLFSGCNKLAYAVAPKQAQFPPDPGKAIDIEVVVVNDDVDVAMPQSQWTQIGAITLYDTDKEDLLHGNWLLDTRMNALHLLKSQFPNINGLENTLRQNVATCKPLPVGSLQILHVNSNHCTTVSTLILT